MRLARRCGVRWEVRMPRDAPPVDLLAGMSDDDVLAAIAAGDVDVYAAFSARFAERMGERREADHAAERRRTNQFLGGFHV